MILFGKGPLLRVLTEYSRHYHHETIREKATGCSSLKLPRNNIGRIIPLSAVSDSAA